MAINRHSFIRMITTCSWAVVVSGGPLVGALIGAVIGAALSSPTAHPDVTIELALIGALVMLAPQVWLEYKRKTYDPTLIFEFDRRFFSNDMKKARSKAAAALLELGGDKQLEDDVDLPDLEDILDFFEDLGFYVKGHQISPELVHHTFYYWLRGYHASARNYLERAHETDPAAWENIQPLLNEAHKIEISRSRGKDIRSLGKQEIDKFLEHERAEWQEEVGHP